MKQPKTSIITFIAALTFMILSAPSTMAQWADPGVERTSHGVGDEPEILGFGGALLEFIENQQAASGTANGLKFSKQGQGVSIITEAYMHYQTNLNQFVFSELGTLNDKKFTIDVDNGNVEVIGDLEVGGEIDVASDMRLKRELTPLTDALAKVNQLKPMSYFFRNDEFSGRNFPEGRRMGFIAQDVEESFPTLVKTGNELTDVHGNSFDMKSVNYLEVIPLLTKAIQEQQAMIEELTSTVASLKAQVE